MKILVTGGDGLLGRELQKVQKDYLWVFTSRITLDITRSEEFEFIDFLNPDVIVHAAAMTTPMIEHKNNPIKSITNNIIGTANIANKCCKKNIKLVYISTDYVYPGNRGNYSELDNLNPVNEYAWSKLGGECSVKLVPNHLILRCAFTERPFKHDAAFTDHIKSYLYVDEAAKLIVSLVEKDIKGIINVGGEPRSVYDFAITTKPEVKKISIHDIEENVPKDTSMQLTKIRGILNEECC